VVIGIKKLTTEAQRKAEGRKARKPESQKAGKLEDEKVRI
jgi:hypothetical protein